MSSKFEYFILLEMHNIEELQIHTSLKNHKVLASQNNTLYSVQITSLTNADRSPQPYL